MLPFTAQGRILIRKIGGVEHTIDINFATKRVRVSRNEPTTADPGASTLVGEGTWDTGFAAGKVSNRTGTLTRNAFDEVEAMINANLEHDRQTKN